MRKILQEIITERVLKNMIQLTLKDRYANKLIQEPVMEIDSSGEQNVDLFVENKSESGVDFENECESGIIFENETDLVNDVTEVEIDSNESVLYSKPSVDDERNLRQNDNRIDDQNTEAQHPFNVTVNNFKTDSKALHFYTGLENYDKFIFVFQTLH